MNEEIVKELEGIKSDLSAKFEAKSKVDLQEAIEQVETKYKGQSEKIDAEIEAVKADFQKKSLAMQDHLDKLDIRLKQANGDKNLETKNGIVTLGEGEVFGFSYTIEMKHLEAESDSDKKKK